MREIKKTTKNRPVRKTREIYERQDQDTRRQMRRGESLDIKEMIESRFSRFIDIVEGNRTKRVTVFEAIVRQIVVGAAKGQKRALRAWNLYQDFAYRDNNRQEIIPIYIGPGRPSERTDQDEQL